MAYSNGSHGAQATPAIYALDDTSGTGWLHLALIAGGWTKVDSGAGGGGSTFYVYSVPAGGFVIFSHIAAGMNIRTSFCEEYNPTTKLATAVCYIGSSTGTLAVDAVGRSTYNYTLSSTNLGTNFTLDMTITAASGVEWWVTVNNYRVVIAQRQGTTDRGVYVGHMTDIPSAASTAFTMVVSSIGGSAHGTTREPGMASTSGLALTQVQLRYWSQPAGTDLYSGRYRGTQIWVETLRNQGGVRGRLRDIVFFYFTGARNGDTMTIDGRTWVCMSGSQAGAPYFVDVSA